MWKQDSEAAPPAMLKHTGNRVLKNSSGKRSGCPQKKLWCFISMFNACKAEEYGWDCASQQRWQESNRSSTDTPRVSLPQGSHSLNRQSMGESNY